MSSKNVFVAATRQNDGKTTVTLGLLQCFRKYTNAIGFIKPVGQRFVEVAGWKIDEDSLLVENLVGGDRERLKDMSPIAIDKGFTERYLQEGNIETLKKLVCESYERAAQDKELMVIEGTGHAGVGSVFDLNNAAVARLLKSKVILVTPGGIGRPLDEIELNNALFKAHGVEVIGVIANKVLPDKLEKVKKYLKIGLERRGMRLFGAIPYTRDLTLPTVQQIVEKLKASVVNGENNLETQVRHVVIGAMTPHNALDYFQPHTLVIIPGDREDIILAALSSSLLETSEERRISGIVLTGDMVPQRTVLELVERTNIPVMSINSDTYTAASKIAEMTVKIRNSDLKKIDITHSLVGEYVDVDAIYQSMQNDN